MHKGTELKVICDFINAQKKARILDYGCDSGFLLESIRKKYPSQHYEVCGADINEHALAYARKKYPSFTFFDINDAFFEKERFDVVILSHVLEHIPDREKLVNNLKKLLNTHGTLIIVVPQERIRGDCTIPEILYNVIRFRFENPHLVKINFDALRELLATQGFQIKKHKYLHLFPPFVTDKRRIDSWSLVTVSVLK